MAVDLKLGVGVDFDEAQIKKIWDEKSKSANLTVKLNLPSESTMAKLEDVKRRLAELKIEPVTIENKQAISSLLKELKGLQSTLETIIRLESKLGNRQNTLAAAKAETELTKQRIMGETALLNKQKAEDQHRNALLRAQRQTQQIQKAEANLNTTRTGSLRIISTQNKMYVSQGIALNGVKQYAAQYASVLGAIRLVNNIKNITSEFELQRTALRALLQDARKADEIYAKTLQLSVKSPFSAAELTRDTKQLAAFRIETSQLHDTIKRLADVSAGTGADMSRIILAYGQVRAASVLRGQEIRQFTEAGIPLVEELARKFTELRGEVVSVSEVFDLVSSRQVPFQMVADVFDDMTKKGGVFYDMQRVQSESLWGIYRNLSDNIQQAFYKIGQSQMDVLRGTGLWLTDMVKNLDQVLQMAANMGIAFAATKLAMGQINKTAYGLFKNEEASVLATKAKEAGLLRAAQAYRQLTAEEQRYLATSGKVTQEEIAALYAKQAITKETIAQMVAVGRLNKEQAKAILIQGRLSARDVYSRVMSGSMTPAAGISYIRETQELNKMVDSIKASHKATIAWRNAQQAFNNVWASFTKMVRANIFLIIVTAITALITKLSQAGKAARDLNNALGEIDSKAIREVQTLDRGFRNLAETITSTSSTIKEKDDALAEMRRTYKDILPDYVMTNQYLKEMEGNYDGVTRAIRDNINMRRLEEGRAKITEKWEKDIANNDALIRQLQRWNMAGDLTATQIEGVLTRVRMAVEGGEDALKAYYRIINQQHGINIYERMFSTGRYGDPINNLRKLEGQIKSLKQEVDSYTAAITEGEDAWGNFYQSFNKVFQDVSKYEAQGASAIERQNDMLRNAREEFIKYISSTPELQQFNIEEILFGTGDIGKIPEDLKATIMSMRGYFTSILGDADVQKINKDIQTLGDQFGITAEKIMQYSRSAGGSMDEWRNGLKDQLEEATAILAKYENDSVKGIKDYTDEQITEQKRLVQFLTSVNEKYSLPTANTEGAGSDPRIQQLKEELDILQKMNTEYTKLRQLMSDTQARDIVASRFAEATAGFQHLDINFDAEGVIRAFDQALAKEWLNSKQRLEISADKVEFAPDLVETLQSELTRALNNLKLEKIIEDGAKSIPDALSAIESKFGDILKRLNVSLDFSLYDNQFIAQVEGLGKKIDSATKQALLDYVATRRDLHKQEMLDNDEYLMQYGEYYDKRLAIIRDGQRREDAILTESGKAIEREATKRALEDLDRSMLEQSAFWIRLFGDADRVTTSYIKDTISQTKQLLDYLNGVEGITLPGMFTESDISSLRGNTELIQKILKALETQMNEFDQRNPFSRMIQGIKGLVAASKKIDLAKKMEKGTEKTEAMKAAMNDQYASTQTLVLGFEDVAKAVSIVSSALENMGIISGEAASILSDTASMALQGFSLSGGSPIGAAIGGILGLISGISGAFGKEARLNRDIEASARRVKLLENAFRDLERQIEQTAGTDKWKGMSDQLANLYQQSKELELQAEKEREKGKKTDENKIIDLEQQAKESIQAMADMVREFQEDMLGGTFQSFATDLASALIGAMVDGKDASVRAWKDGIDEIVRNMIIKFATVKLIEPKVEKWLNDVMMTLGMSDPAFESKAKELQDKIKSEEEYRRQRLNNLADYDPRAAVESIKRQEQYQKELDTLLASLDVDMKDLTPERMKEIAKSAGVNLGENFAGDVYDFITKLFEAAGVSLLGEESNITGIQKEYGTMTEDTGLTLAAMTNSMLFYAIANHNLFLQWNEGLLGAEGMIPLMRQYQINALATMNAIKNDTARIVVAVERTADGLSSVIIPIGGSSTYKIAT